MAQSAINTNTSSLPSSSTVIKTSLGNGTTAGLRHLKGRQIGSLYPEGGDGSNYLIWSGNYTSGQLTAENTWNPDPVQGPLKSANSVIGFMGILSYGYNYETGATEIYYRTTKSGSVAHLSAGAESGTELSSTRGYIAQTIYTLVPIT